MCVNLYHKRQCGKKHGFSLFVCACNISGKSCTRCCSFTAVVAFGDGNLFLQTSVGESLHIYFECKVVSLFVCNGNRRCLLSKVILFKRKSARVCNYFECKVVSMFVCNGSGAVFAWAQRV